jgi:4-amino-4-deoxy-L-arabinose transferase-like glycosyltransferase
MSRRLAIAAMVVFIAHLVFLLLVPSVPLGRDTLFYDQLGRSIAAGDGITVDNEPVSEVMPGYPIFLSALYALFGPHTWIVHVVQALLVTVAACGVFLLVRRCGVRAASMSFFAMALLPAWFIYPGTLNAEVLLVSVEVLFLTLSLRQGGNTFSWAASSGASCGLLALVKPEFFVWLPLPLLVRGNRRFVTTAVASVLGFALVLSPWVVRNAREFHQFIPFSTHSGHVMWLSAHQPELTEQSDPEYVAALVKCHIDGDPKGTDACLQADARRMVLQHPGYFLKASMGRALRTLFGSHTDCLPGSISRTSFVDAWKGRRFDYLALKVPMLLVQVIFVLVGLGGIVWLCRARQYWFLLYLFGSKLAVNALLFGTSRYGLHLTPVLAAGWGVLGWRVLPRAWALHDNAESVPAVHPNQDCSESGDALGS